MYILQQFSVLALFAIFFVSVSKSQSLYLSLSSFSLSMPHYAPHSFDVSPLFVSFSLFLSLFHFLSFSFSFSFSPFFLCFSFSLSLFLCFCFFLLSLSLSLSISLYLSASPPPLSINHCTGLVKIQLQKVLRAPPSPPKPHFFVLSLSLSLFLSPHQGVVFVLGPHGSANNCFCCSLRQNVNKVWFLVPNGKMFILIV